MQMNKRSNKLQLALGALGLSAVVAFGTVAVAGPGHDKGDKTHMKGKRGGDRMQKMAEKLNLTADQQAQIKPILQASMEQMKALRTNENLTREQKRTQMKAIHEATQARINPILTPTQRQQLAEMKKNRGERRGGKHRSKN